jgi:uncharacterized protein YwqG
MEAMEDRSAFVDAANRHLPEDLAARWIPLLRPAIDLRAAGTGSIAGNLGGDPLLPVDTPWPVWEGHGPLTFVAGLDCAMLRGTDLDLPERGSLLFFYFDGQIDGSQALVNGRNPETAAGARVLYVDASMPVEPRAHPGELRPYPSIPLHARTVWSAPDEDSPALADAFDLDDAETAGPLMDEDFIEELAPWDKPLHQVGGYPSETQGAPEYEVSSGRYPDLDSESPAFTEASNGWRLLLQVSEEEDAQMHWGDTGGLYWFMTADDVRHQRFDRAAFTWQSG